MGLALTYMKDKSQLQQTPVDVHAAHPILSRILQQWTIIVLIHQNAIHSFYVEKYFLIK